MVATRVAPGQTRMIGKRPQVDLPRDIEEHSTGLRLAVVRDVFANLSDVMTFQDIPQGRSDMISFWRRGLWSSTKEREAQGWPTNLKYCMYNDLAELNLGWYNAIDVAEIYHDWTAHCVERWPGKTFVTVWDNIPYNGWNAHTPGILQGAKGFIGRSELTCKILEDKYDIPEDKIFFVPAGVDTTKFSPATNVGDNRFSDKPTILFAGRLVWEKGLLDLIYACDGMPWTLVIAGSGPMHSLLTDGSLPDSIDVRVIGSVPHHEMPEVYRMCDVFCYPSIPTQYWVEQFGISVIEAMASGLPCVTTDVGAFLDFKDVYGKAVEVVPAMRYDLLRDALAKVIKNRKRLSVQARELTLEHYDSRAIGELLAEVYNSE